MNKVFIISLLIALPTLVLASCTSSGCSQLIYNGIPYQSCNYTDCTEKPYNVSIENITCFSQSCSSGLDISNITKWNCSYVNCSNQIDTNLMCNQTEWISKFGNLTDNCTSTINTITSKFNNCNSSLISYINSTSNYEKLSLDNATCYSNNSVISGSLNNCNQARSDVEGGRGILFIVGLIVGAGGIYMYITKWSKPQITRNAETVSIQGETPLYNSQALEKDAKERQLQAELKDKTNMVQKLDSELSTLRKNVEELMKVKDVKEPQEDKVVKEPKKKIKSLKKEQPKVNADKDLDDLYNNPDSSNGSSGGI